ncbi:SgcJ/EcaC family oxidoreductase [soil metagenome]
MSPGAFCDRRVVRIFLAAGCALGSAACDHPGSGSDTSRDEIAIVDALRQWPVDFDAEHLDAVCGLFADDVVLVYPNSADRGHDQFCDQMRINFADPTKKFSYAAPDIRDVRIDGDLGAVRLIWTLTVRDASGRVLETVAEDGVDVFRRQPDGSWKIVVSHAFPLE